MSLRLSSNLMIGVTRIYGQQWTNYCGDVNLLSSNLSHVFSKARSVDMVVERAPVEAITLPQKHSLDLNMSDPVCLVQRGGAELTL